MLLSLLQALLINVGLGRHHIISLRDRQAAGTVRLVSMLLHSH